MRPFIVRVLVALAQLAAVLTGVFALTSLLPGDTAIVILGEHATSEQVQAVRERMHLDRPPVERFVEWAGNLLHGDLGVSLLTNQPVADEVARGAGTTLVLAVTTLALVVPLALFIGITSGLRPGSRTDRVLIATAVFLQSAPEFAVGLLLVGTFAVYAGWLPATAAGLSGFSLFTEPAALVLPIAVLVCKQLCALARQVRVGVIDAARADHARHLRLLGLPERDVVLRHVLPNALGPSVQVLARTVDGLLGGVVVVEALFALPGLGSAFVEAVQARDLPAVQGYALVFAVTTITVNLLADLLTRRLVPQREVMA